MKSATNNPGLVLDDSHSLLKYEAALEGTMDWLRRSVENGAGGSCAYYGVWGRWSKPYPETTGYLIPTLLSWAARGNDSGARLTAIRLGEWLLAIQRPDGAWNGGLHPPRDAHPSVFNTGQILLGLVALFNATGENRWSEAASRGAEWLAEGVGPGGAWNSGNYQAGFNPSYYTRVAWPMLEVWQVTQNMHVYEAAVRVLSAIRNRQAPNGVIRGWGFEPNKPAFTHTIAYTIRGFQEAARLLQHEVFYTPTREAIERLYRKAELSHGRLAGTYDDGWRGNDRFVCLTGNAQVALCLMIEDDRSPDLRLINAASKLIDFVCDAQKLRHPLPGVRGGIAGSKPLWGRYLTLRYPNWAAKFFADALMRLIDVLMQDRP